MGTRLICLFVAAYLRGGAWPWDEDSSAAGASAEVPDASGGTSEEFDLSSVFPRSLGASPEGDIEWTWWEPASARPEAGNLRLTEKLSLPEGDIEWTWREPAPARWESGRPSLA